MGDAASIGSSQTSGNSGELTPHESFILYVVRDIMAALTLLGTSHFIFPARSSYQGTSFVCYALVIQRKYEIFGTKLLIYLAASCGFVALVRRTLIEEFSTLVVSSYPEIAMNFKT